VRIRHHDAGGNLHGGADRPGKNDHASGTCAHRLIRTMPETDATAATAARKIPAALSSSTRPPWNPNALQRQRHSLIRNSGRQVDSEIEAGSP